MEPAHKNGESKMDAGVVTLYSVALILLLVVAIAGTHTALDAHHDVRDLRCKIGELRGHAPRAPSEAEAV